MWEDVPDWRVEPAVTTQQLARLRREFWETRIEGSKEMWDVLKFAVDDEDNAAALLKAAGLRPVNKTMERVYGERGFLYEIPTFVLKDPTNLNQAPTCKEQKDAARAVAEYTRRNNAERGLTQ